MRKNRSLKCVVVWVLCACWLVGAGTCAAAQQGGFEALALEEPGPADIPREAAQQAAMEALVQAGAVRPAAQQGLYDIPMFEMTDVSLAAAVAALADAYGVSRETLTQERSVAFWFYEDKVRGGRWWRIAFDRYDPQSNTYQEGCYVELNAQDCTVYDLGDGSGMG